MTRVFPTPAALGDAVGEELGASGYRLLDQAAVNAFAALTGDDQWIHVDIERARNGPWGAPLVHGLLTLSLYKVLRDEVFAVGGVRQSINYGANRVRFPSPCPVGSRVRATVRVVDADDVGDAVQLVYTMTFEREGGDRPVCVAELVSRFYPE